jgi:hypothetical protein
VLVLRERAEGAASGFAALPQEGTPLDSRATASHSLPMFLADWSGRRVAAYAITWLVGFPVVTAAFVIIGAMTSTGSGGFTVAPPTVMLGEAARPDSLTPEARAWRDSIMRELRRRDSIMAAGGPPADSVRAVAFLPRQGGDVAIGIDASHDSDWGYGPFELLFWLLPPALLVAAWAWTRRSRPEPD